MDKVSTLRWDGNRPGPHGQPSSAFYTNRKTLFSPTTESASILSPQGVGYGKGINSHAVCFDRTLSFLSQIHPRRRAVSTIFKDTRALAKQAVQMAVALLEGKPAQVNDTKTYDNGVKVVPSYLLESTIVTKDNVTAALIDSGYYTADQIK